MVNENTVIAMPGQSASRTSGENFTVVIPSPRCFVDSHSHIENGSCAPLPLLWDQAIVFRLLKPGRYVIDFLATQGATGLLFNAFQGRAGVLQVLPTSEIGNKFIAAIDKTFEAKSDLGKSVHYKHSALFSCAVIMTMDMEYAHIAGYNGQTIYHEDEAKWYFYKRRFGNVSENKGDKQHLLTESQKSFSKWWKQLFETKQAVITNPFSIIPMYHYEPRRWNYSKATPTDSNYQKGPWHYPLDKVATKTNKGLYIGIKMYPSLGYKPLDKRLPYMHDPKDGGCFYAQCMSDGIPILTHCSPGGMTTHEMKYYMEYDETKPPYPSQQQHSMQALDTPPDATTASYDYQGKTIQYFYDNYVHPRAWHEVLKKYRSLKLCLAHFGGDLFPQGFDNDWIKEIVDLIKEYPNVYTDVSCWNLDKNKETFKELLLNKKYDYLKDRILFGTDWYMTLLALGGKSYQSFCEEFYSFILEMPDGKDLWIRFSFLNPFEFYGFHDKAIIDNLNSALKDIKADATKREKNYQHLCSLQKEYENQRKRLEKYKKA
jgi:hypothetical protein